MTGFLQYDQRLVKPHRIQELLGWVGKYLFGALVCIGLPALFTAVVPVTYLKLTRHGDQVSAQSQTCLLFFFPYYWQSLENVLEVGSEFQAGEMTDYVGPRDDHTDRQFRSEDHGWLVLKEHEHQMKFSLTPANLEEYRRRVREFLEQQPEASGASSELKLFCVTNWKASILAGVPLAMLSVLYLVCVFSPLIEYPIRWLMRSFSK